MEISGEIIKIQADLQKQTQDFQVKVKELEVKTMESAVDNTKSARILGAEWLKAGKKNTRADILAYLSIVMLFFCVAASLWTAYYTDMTDPGIQGLFALLNLITGGVLKTVHDVYGYEFGGSQGSENKTGLISNLMDTITNNKK